MILVTDIDAEHAETLIQQMNITYCFMIFNSVESNTLHDVVFANESVKLKFVM